MKRYLLILCLAGCINPRFQNPTPAPKPVPLPPSPKGLTAKVLPARRVAAMTLVEVPEAPTPPAILTVFTNPVPVIPGARVMRVAVAGVRCVAKRIKTVGGQQQFISSWTGFTSNHVFALECTSTLGGAWRTNQTARWIYGDDAGWNAAVLAGKARENFRFHDLGP